MVKILYAMAQEGMGHAIRSKVIIEMLLKRHTVRVIAGGRSFIYLSRYFKYIHRMFNFELVYTNNSINKLLTCLYNLIKFPFIFIYNLKIIKLIVAFKPDIIITDFDLFSNYLSTLFDIPLISIDNQHLVTKCDIKIPKKHVKDYLISYLIIKLVVNKAQNYFITSFFFPKTKHKNVFLFPPILRDEILRLDAKKGDHILVYQTSKSYKAMFEVFKKINQKFIIYGFDMDYNEKNLVFRKFNEKSFFNDLAKCKAVITNGGFTLISEALCLKKPVLSIPIRHQFEQILNALYIKRLGYGAYHDFLTEENLGEFLSNLSKYGENLKKYPRGDNSAILTKLETVLKRFEQ